MRKHRFTGARCPRNQAVHMWQQQWKSIPEVLHIAYKDTIMSLGAFQAQKNTDLQVGIISKIASKNNFTMIVQGNTNIASFYWLLCFSDSWFFLHM